MSTLLLLEISEEICLIVMRTDASQDQIAAIVNRVEDTTAYTAHLSHGEERTVIGVVGDGRPYQYHEQFLHLPGVDRIVPISPPYKLASRDFIPENSHFPIDGIEIGGAGRGDHRRAVLG